MLTKIATCCYCGTRAALVLRGEQRHELACSSCGAPLHNLKSMPKRAAPKAVAQTPRHADKKRPKSGKKPKKSRPKLRMGRFLDEAWDMLEDIFD